MKDAASGIQISIPIILVLQGDAKKVIPKQKYVIEEPELGLFPKAQYDLLKLIKEITINLKNPKQSLFITTHSPYILSSLNNLMYAYNVGQKNEKVNDVIDKKYWVNPEDVSAYMLYADGRYENIMSQEQSQIDTDYIDTVSEVMHEEFNQIWKLTQVDKNVA